MHGIHLGNSVLGSQCFLDRADLGFGFEVRFLTRRGGSGSGITDVSVSVPAASGGGAGMASGGGAIGAGGTTGWTTAGGAGAGSSLLANSRLIAAALATTAPTPPAIQRHQRRTGRGSTTLAGDAAPRTASNLEE
jgi:hypothetical protein